SLTVDPSGVLLTCNSPLQKRAPRLRDSQRALRRITAPASLSVGGDRRRHCPNGLKLSSDVTPASARGGTTIAFVAGQRAAAERQGASDVVEGVRAPIGRRGSRGSAE